MARDKMGRALRDLRVSVTDRCNFRCGYCMPREKFGRHHKFLPNNRILSYEQIQRFIAACIPLGLNKVRITGGEPLLRRDLFELVSMVSSLGLEVALTTNGSLLADQSDKLYRAGLNRVTVSLDALDPDLHSKITDSVIPVGEVIRGIESAVSSGLNPVKVNCVVRRGLNEAEVAPLVRHFRGTGVIVRFIEFMDVGSTNRWSFGQVVPTSEVLQTLSSEFDLFPMERKSPTDVASRWAHSDGSGEIGFISSVTEPFCGGCVRARLSSDGKLFTCLFSNKGYDLADRLTFSEPIQVLTAEISKIWSARSDRYSELRSPKPNSLPRVEMSYIGG